MPFPSLVSRFVHDVPPDLDIYSRSGFKALGTVYTHPYFITVDMAGSRTHLWSVASQEPAHVVTLEPSLPCNITHNGGIVGRIGASATLLVAAGRTEVDQHEEDNWGVLRLYNMQSGMLVQDVQLPCMVGFMQKRDSDLLAVSARSRASASGIVVLFKMESEKLVEVRRFSSFPAKADVFLMNISDEDTVLVGHSTYPYSNFDKGDLTLTMRSASRSTDVTITSARVSRPANWLRVEQVEELPGSKLIVSVQETDSWSQFRDTQSTIYVLQLPSLSRVWQTHLPFHVESFTYHPSLEMIVAVSPLLRGDETTLPIMHIAFLDAGSGAVVREESFRCREPNDVTARCSTTDLLVVVTHTRWLAVIPLRDILENSLQAKDEEGVVLTQAIDIDPMPYITGDTGYLPIDNPSQDSRWLDHYFVAPAGALLLPLKGLDIFFVKW